MAATVNLLASAVKDLKRMGKGPERDRVRAGLERLAGEDPALDIKTLQGAAPWLRQRIGDYRALYRPVDDPEHGRTLVVARIVHRRDLETAAANLPAANHPEA